MSERTETVKTQTRQTRQAVSDAAGKAADAGRQAKDMASEASGVVGGVIDGAVDILGGWSELDSNIKKYNRAFYDFASDSFLSKISATNKPSRLLLCLLGLGILQSVVPVFAWPLDMLARLLGFVFLYNSGLDQLRRGFKYEAKAPFTKSLLTVFLLTSILQIIPAFLFDATHHFGALWGFFLPVLLFCTPDVKEKDVTLANLVCDTLFNQISKVIESVIPESVRGKAGEGFAMITGAILALLLWVGYLGASGSYMVTWTFLALSTIDTLGATFVPTSVSSSGYVVQQTTWHNLLAIWLWRYLLSAIEGMSVPGIASVIGLITYYVPSYFLWQTGFMVAMLMTKKTADPESKRANTWYAQWLLGKGVAKLSGAAPSSSERSTSERRTKREE